MGINFTCRFGLIEKIFVVAFVVFGFFVVGVDFVDARLGYDGGVLGVNPDVVSVFGSEEAVVRVRVKNTGDEGWSRYGDNHVSVYTYEPKYHVSPYRGPSWYSDHQAGHLVEDVLEPGEVGTVEFFVYGPPGFEGELSEHFRIAVEDISWVSESFSVDMVVGEHSVVVGVVEKDDDEDVDDKDDSVVGDEVDGFVLITSKKKVVARANEEVFFRVGYKNSGVLAWDGYVLKPAGVTELAVVGGVGDEVSYVDSTWVSEDIVKEVSGKNVDVGRIEWVDFSFRVPNVAGEYVASFKLASGGVDMESSVLKIPVIVTSNAAKIIDAPKKTEPLIETVYVMGDVIEEPRVRVGIEILEDVAVFSANKAVRVLESDMGYERFIIPADQIIEVKYNGSEYVLKSGDILFTSMSYLKFQGENADTIFTIHSREDIRTWNASLNDNTFRDTIEIRYNSDKDRTWMINELPMEYYLRGIDETSDYAPLEYHKTMYTAARTYATYNWESKTKYAGEGIDLRSSTYDQVYHGYGAEIRRPNVVEAIDDTRGQVIEYGGDTIIASYFARSDGHTRSWADVWGRDVPYAVSVSVPCEVGRTKWGHGVGLSAGGALCMSDEGSTYDEILKYFYTGVDLVKRW